MKRWMFIVAWFLLQFLYNFLAKTSSTQYALTTRVVIAAMYYLAPIQILIAAGAVIAILKYPWKRKNQPEL